MKLSIITINRNNAEGLRKTMESVLSQTYRDFEYIVVDGASTDNSVEIIKGFSPLAHGLDFKWISEPDTGIYNAMNKGCRMAMGEYTLMLNSGDYLLDEHVIEKVLPELHDEDIVQGNVLYEKDGRLWRDKGYAHSDLRMDEIVDGMFQHQASFIKRSLWLMMGGYDESYQKNADTYFYVMALGFRNATFRYADMDISYFDMSGISNSNDLKWRKIDAEENRRFYKESVPSRFYDYYMFAQKRIAFYEVLHKNKFLWYCAVFLSVIARKIYGKYSKTYIEEVGKSNKERE